MKFSLILLAGLAATVTSNAPKADSLSRSTYSYTGADNSKTPSSIYTYTSSSSSSGSNSGNVDTSKQNIVSTTKSGRTGGSSSYSRSNAGQSDVKIQDLTGFNTNSISNSGIGGKLLSNDNVVNYQSSGISGKRNILNSFSSSSSNNFGINNAYNVGGDTYRDAFTNIDNRSFNNMNLNNRNQLNLNQRSFPFDQIFTSNYSPGYSDRAYNSLSIINKASRSTASPNRSLNSYFLRFPSLNEIDNLIISGDIAAILKTIQMIATDGSVTCDQRLAYLSELLGRLKTAIQKKAYSAAQLKIVIQSSVNEIRKLQEQVQTTRKLINNLGIQQLKDRQASQIAQLQQVYQKFNSVEGQTPILQAKIKGYDKQIEILIKNSEAQRNRVDVDRLKLVDITNEVVNLDNKLKQLLNKQKVLETSISKGQALLLQNQNKIVRLRSQLTNVQIQLKKIRDLSDKTNSQVRDLEVKVQRVRTDISIDQAKKQRYMKQLVLLNDKINEQKRKIVQDELQKVNQMVFSLRKLVPAVQLAIDDRYYSCYGDGQGVSTQKSGNILVYIVSGNKFGDYLRNLYGKTIVVPSIRSDVVFNKVDIFGSDWTGNFGYPFNDSAFGSTDFSFSGSFSCLNSQNIQSGSGVISNIGPNYIQAKCDNNANMRFNLGSCSRLQSTSRVPKIGQKFYWSGAPKADGFDLFGATCFD